MEIDLPLPAPQKASEQYIIIIIYNMLNAVRYDIAACKNIIDSSSTAISDLFSPRRGVYYT